MIIRPATPHDARAIAEVHVSSWRTTYVGQFPHALLDQLSVPQRESMWERLLNDLSHRTFVAKKAGGIVGFSDAGPSRDQDSAPYVGELYTIYLIEEHKGRSIGKALWMHNHDALRELGYTEVTLWVLDTNLRAREFYEKLGFKPDGARKRDTFDRQELTEVRYRRRVG